MCHGSCTAPTSAPSTSCFGAERLTTHGPLGFAPGGAESTRAFETARDQFVADLCRSFRPELINRIDEIVVFHPLTREQLLGIARVLFDDLRARMRAREIDLTFTDDAVEYVADRGYDPQFGARPLRRTIQRLVENELSRLLLRESVGGGDTVGVRMADDGLQFVVRRAGEPFPDEPTWQAPRDVRVEDSAGPAEPRQPG